MGVFMEAATKPAGEVYCINCAKEFVASVYLRMSAVSKNIRPPACDSLCSEECINLYVQAGFRSGRNTFVPPPEPTDPVAQEAMYWLREREVTKDPGYKVWLDKYVPGWDAVAREVDGLPPALTPEKD